MNSLPVILFLVLLCPYLHGNNVFPAVVPCLFIQTSSFTSSLFYLICFCADIHTSTAIFCPLLSSLSIISAKSLLKLATLWQSPPCLRRRVAVPFFLQRRQFLLSFHFLPFKYSPVCFVSPLVEELKSYITSDHISPQHLSALVQQHFSHSKTSAAFTQTIRPLILWAKTLFVDIAVLRLIMNMDTVLIGEESHLNYKIHNLDHIYSMNYIWCHW